LATTDNIRNQLIDKKRQIKNQDFLEVLDNLFLLIPQKLVLSNYPKNKRKFWN